MQYKKVLFKTKTKKNCIRCGKCCQIGLILTHEDVRCIAEFLETIPYDTWKQFAFDCWTAFRPHLFNVPNIEKKVEEFIKIVKTKFHAISIYQLSENDQQLVFGLDHSLSAAYKTICRFFNPITSDCLIYSVRPDICRLYPYLVHYSDQKNELIISIDEGCPGEGTPMTKTFQKELFKLAYQRVRRMRLYYAKLYKYVRENYPLEKKLLKAILDALHGFEKVSERVAQKSVERLITVFREGKHIGSDELYEKISSKNVKIVDLFNETYDR
ncbi:MAG: YkgJ family cysteine cluster protein [Promethearchaeota archaeon]